MDKYQDILIHEFMCMYYYFIFLIMTYSPKKNQQFAKTYL